ncbi:hypothetical protein SSP35_32_00010 [Streptomyces sp. NBRC 110611]|uniref:hypothetical protein n=1 Tax=Streptomyces sp. NBRC 110611 TaxID=1621259 RepID=UPI00085712B0|nr:hypothetical protein [Streptomyces sp. NBRC 110611]GAU71272.1 hypothetical protein SSP35_32_00010 [Streptomyces sp. NBRC 110611]
MGDDLQRLVVARLAELGSPRRPLSYRAAAARSQGHVSHGTIGRIARGQHSGVLEDETLDGLALALDVPRTRIEKAAGIFRERPLQPFTLPARASLLSRSEREVVLSVVDALLAAATRTGATCQPKSAASPGTAHPVKQTPLTSRVPERDDHALVAYAVDGTGRISAADLETIRRHEEGQKQAHAGGEPSKRP